MNEIEKSVLDGMSEALLPVLAAERFRCACNAAECVIEALARRRGVAITSEEIAAAAAIGVSLVEAVGKIIREREPRAEVAPATAEISAEDIDRLHSMNKHTLT